MGAFHIFVSFAGISGVKMAAGRLMLICRNTGVMNRCGLAGLYCASGVVYPAFRARGIVGRVREWLQGLMDAAGVSE